MGTMVPRLFPVRYKSLIAALLIVIVPILAHWLRAEWPEE
jgi:hypothetical protein